MNAVMTKAQKDATSNDTVELFVNDTMQYVVSYCVYNRKMLTSSTLPVLEVEGPIASLSRPWLRVRLRPLISWIPSMSGSTLFPSAEAIRCAQQL